MAALLVAMAVLAIMMTVAMPVWKQAAQREKEEELVFRGMQYAHAIGMFQRKYANAYPPSFDVLVTERFLRKKFKDPITNDDFAPILAGQNTQGGAQIGAANAGGRGAGANAPGAPDAAPNAQPPAGRGAQIGPTTPGGPGGSVGGGIIGVTSKSKDKSIRLYNGRSHYNEWQFVWVPQTQAPGAGAPGTGAPGQPGRGQNPTNPFNPSGPLGGSRGGNRGRQFGPGGQQPSGQPPQRNSIPGRPGR